MLKLLVITTTILSSSAFATICESPRQNLTRLFAEKSQLPNEYFTISNIKVSINPVLFPVGMVRDHGCSSLGMKATADIEYKVMDKICTAKLVKPSYSENKIKLVNNICENE